MQDIMYIILLSTGSLLILFLLTKMMGNKQLSELSIFDYITGITIGSIAAEMATSLEQDFVRPIVAMAVYTFFSLLLAFLNEKSFFLRKVITGKPVVLIDQGIISEDNLRLTCLNYWYNAVSTAILIFPRFRLPYWKKTERSAFFQRAANVRSPRKIYSFSHRRSIWSPI